METTWINNKHTHIENKTKIKGLGTGHAHKNKKLTHGIMNIGSKIYKWDYKWECNALKAGVH